MSRLGGAEIIGGIVVTIGGDIGPLTSSVNQAKIVAAQAEKSLAIRVPIITDGGSRLRAEVAQAVSAAQVMANANPIRIPVILSSPSSIGGFSLPSSGAMPMLGGGGSRQTTAADFVEGELVSSRTTSTPMIGVPSTGGAGSGGGGWGGSGGGRSGGSGGGGWGGSGGGRSGGSGGGGWGNIIGRAGSLGRMARFATVGFAGIEAYRVLSSYGTLQSKTAQATTARQQYDAEMEFQNSIPTAPLWEMSLTGGRNGFGEFADRTARIVADADRQDLLGDRRFQRYSNAQDLANTFRTQRLTQNMTDQQSTTFKLRDQLADFETQNGSSGLKGGIKQAHDELIAALARSVKMEAAEAAGTLRDARIGFGASIGGATASFIGMTQGSAAGARASTLVGARTANSQALSAIMTLHEQGIPLTDPRMKAAMLNAGATFISGATAIIGQNVQDAKDSVHAGQQSSANISIMAARTAGDSYGAARQQINKEYGDRIYDATQTYGANDSRVQALKNERTQALVGLSAERQTASNNIVAASRANSAIITEQSKGNEDAARMLEIRRDYAEKLKGVNNGRYGPFPAGSIEARNAAAIITERDSAIAGQQKLTEQHQKITDVNLSTRTSVANARGGFEPQFADALSLIGQLKAEYIGAPEKDRGKVLSTEEAELISAKNQLLRPIGYATGGDRFRDAPGGPGGETGKDFNDAIAALTDAIKAWSDAMKNGGLPH